MLACEHTVDPLLLLGSGAAILVQKPAADERANQNDSNSSALSLDNGAGFVSRVEPKHTLRRVSG